MKHNSLIKQNNQPSAADILKNDVGMPPATKAEKDKGHKSLRVREEDYNMVVDLMYDRRYKSQAEAFEEIIEVYKNALKGELPLNVKRDNEAN